MKKAVVLLALLIAASARRTAEPAGAHGHRARACTAPTARSRRCRARTRRRALVAADGGEDQDREEQGAARRSTRPQLALNEKTQRIQGFMMPLEPGEKQTHFLLSSVPLTCAFCVPGGPESMVEVKTRTPVQLHAGPGDGRRQVRRAGRRPVRAVLPHHRSGEHQVEPVHTVFARWLRPQPAAGSVLGGVVPDPRGEFCFGYIARGDGKHGQHACGVVCRQTESVELEKQFRGHVARFFCCRR